MCSCRLVDFVLPSIFIPDKNPRQPASPPAHRLRNTLCLQPAFVKGGFPIPPPDPRSGQWNVSNSWTFRIAPDLDSSSDIFSCPEYQPGATLDGFIKPDAFGYNAGGSSQVYVNMAGNLGLGYGPSNFVCTATLAAPSDMIALGDLQTPNALWVNIISPWHKTPIGNLKSFVPSRHGGGANMAFADAHVEGASQAHWIAEEPLARSRWNNDHQPHPETW